MQAQGTASCPPGAQLDCGVPSSLPPPPETRARAPGHRCSPEARAGDSERLAKESGGEVRLDLSSVCAGRRLWAPLQGLPPAGGTYLDPLLRLRKSRLGGRLRLQRLKSFQTQSGTSHLRSPACTRALGRRDEDGRRRRSRRRSALPAPSRPPARSPLLRPPRPRPAQVPEERGAQPEDAAAAVPCAAGSPPRPESPAGASAEAPGAPSLPTFAGRSAPPRGEGVSYRLKITASEHWVSPSLPATRPGEGLGQPPRTSPRRARCGQPRGSGGTWETRAHRGVHVPGVAGGATAGREHARAVA